MSGVDLSRNKDAILKAHKEVSNPDGSLDWALFGYEGRTNVLKVVETGDGGIEELVDELNSGRIQYAYLKVNDPNTGLAKFVLINWQGEGVQESRKGSCAHHFRDVSSLLKGAHVTINARSEDDVDEDIIKDKVAKASGANYGFHKEKAQIIPEAGPVSSVYKKTVPVIKSDARDKFWEKQQQLEKQRQEEESQRRTDDQKKNEQERRKREEEETANREQRESERLKKIREIKAAERKANAVDSEAQKQHWENVQKEALKDDEERRKRSENARKERAAEARSLVARRPSDPRSVFEQKPRSMFDDDSPASPTSPTSPTSPGFRPPPSRKLQQSFIKEDTEEPSKPLPRKQPIKLPTAEPEFDKPTVASPPSVPQQPPRIKPTPEPVPEPKPEPASPVYYDDEPPAETAPSRPPQPAPVSPKSPTYPVAQATSEMPKTRNLLAEGLPQRQTSDDEEEDDQDWEDDNVQKPQAVIASPVTEQPPEEDNYYEEVPATNDYSDEPQQEEETINPQSPYADEGTIFLNKGQCARALYDYQAEDDSEISFDPDDIITNIEQIDAGWWTGTAPDGNNGMFPANYVELM